MRDARDLRRVEIKFAIFVADWMKIAPFDHSQNGPATAVKQFSYVLYHEAVGSGRVGIGWLESGIEQECQPVLEDGSPLARVGGGQFRVKVD